MANGYVYVLKNPAFGDYVVKIGFTTVEPDFRASGIYYGSTGVPLPFDVFAAYSVGDCQKAENQIKKRLRAFRLNPRREFFRVPPSVATSLIQETCAKINLELGLSAPTPYILDKSKTQKRKIGATGADSKEERTYESEVFQIEIDKLHQSPINTSTLTSDQLDRVHILNMLLAQVLPTASDEMVEDFTRDENPEREVQIWEHILKAYLTIEQVEFASEELKKEALGLLLQRSAVSTEVVLRETTLKHFTVKAAKRLLQSYELRPKPVTARYVPNANLN